jgi:DNA-binding CsgD family transcriptional regulator
MLADSADMVDQFFAEAMANHIAGSFEEARTRLCWGEQLRRHGRRQSARRQLDSALATFDALGALPWRQRTRDELATVGVRVEPVRQSALADLTAKELQVALAVGRGLTNREAAAALFVSPKTVEYHLGRVFAKLGVSSRTQLSHTLRQLEPTTENV